LTLLSDLPVGAQVEFRDFLAVIEGANSHAVYGRTQAGFRFSVRGTHVVEPRDSIVYVDHWQVNVRALHVSPSQVVQYNACPRQWALDKIAGIKRGGNKFSDRGGRVHGVLENWQRFATPPDLSDPIGAIAYPALAVTPAPGTATPERCVNWEVGGIEIEFLKDLEEFTPWGVHIYDYKTTSNLAYAHTATDLLETDPQSITYAAHAFIEYQAPAVRESWLYLTANKPHRCLPVVVDPQKDDCLARFELICATGREMIAHRIAQTDPEKFPQKTSHCSAFGGCPYKGTHCQPDEVRSALDQMAASIFSQIAAAGQPAPAQPPPPPVPAMAWPPQPAAAAPVAPPAVAPAAPPPWVTGTNTAVQTSPFPQVAQASAPVAPPAMPASMAPPAWLTPAPVASAPAVAPEAPAEQPAAPAKRTRRTKAEIQMADMNKAIENTDGQTQVAPAPEYAPSAPEPTKAPAQTDQSEIDTEAHFWDLLASLAMNPGFAGCPAVDLADRALALVVAGQNALGGS
jgi:hypothetical protein